MVSVPPGAGGAAHGGWQAESVAERTLHRFAAERCGAGGQKVTTPVDDGQPGGELQIDFGYRG